MLNAKRNSDVTPTWFNTFSGSFSVISAAARGDLITAHKSLYDRPVLAASFHRDGISRPNASTTIAIIMCSQGRLTETVSPGTETFGQPKQATLGNRRSIACFFFLMISRLMLGMASTKAFLLSLGSCLSKVSCRREKSYFRGLKLDTRNTFEHLMPCAWRPVIQKESMWQIIKMEFINLF